MMTRSLQIHALIVAELAKKEEGFLFHFQQKTPPTLLRGVMERN